MHLSARNIFLFFLFVLFGHQLSTAQVIEEEDLSFYADVMVNAMDAEHRIYAHQKFYDAFKKEILNPNSFENTYEDIPWISIQYPTDKSFRIITWQLQKANFEFEYFGFIQNPLETIELGSSVAYSKDLTYETLDFDNYFSGLIYRIDQLEDQYIVYGMHQLNKEYKVKSLFIIKDFSIVNDAFVKDPSARRIRKQSNISIKYSVRAEAGFNYNSDLKTILFDHIVVNFADERESEANLVPDGSYEGYTWNGEDRWFYEENPLAELEKELLRSTTTKSRKRDNRN